MNRHYSDSFWHYGFENETELHVFVYGTVRYYADGNSGNACGVFFGYADKRNWWGEIEGPVSTERAQLGAMSRALSLVQNDARVLHVHTSNVQVVDRLEQWIAVWTKSMFQSHLGEDDPVNSDLVRTIAQLLKSRTSDIYFESVYQAAKVPGCALAMSLALEEVRGSRSLPLPGNRWTSPVRRKQNLQGDDIPAIEEFRVDSSGYQGDAQLSFCASMEHESASTETSSRSFDFTRNKSHKTALIAS